MRQSEKGDTSVAFKRATACGWTRVFQASCADADGAEQELANRRCGLCCCQCLGNICLPLCVCCVFCVFVFLCMHVVCVCGVINIGVERRCFVGDVLRRLCDVM